MPAEDMDVDADLAPGTQVGEYTVETRLGAGAFGVVYKASHPVIGKLVAIKVLSLKFSVDPEASTRRVAEARAVNQIRHRHIIDIFSFGKLPDGRQYYVMEYLDGETMDAMLERERKLPLEKLLPVIRGIAQALDAAHAKQLAHRGRHAVLHVARAGARPRARSPHRHLLVRRARVPVADRHVSVRRRRSHLDPDAARDGGSRCAEHARARIARRRRRGRAAAAAQGSRRAAG